MILRGGGRLQFRISLFQVTQQTKHRRRQQLSDLRANKAMASPKVVLVTGGNNGIGYEAVKALLRSDKAYHVLLGSRSLEKAKLAIEKLHKECPESISNTVEVVQVDLTSDESIEKAFEQVKASPGHIDALINNAGMMETSPFLPQGPSPSN